MTHTLHRIKSIEGQTDDYVVLIMPARGINNQNCVEVFKQYFDLLVKFNPVNMGGIGCGVLLTNTVEEMKANLRPDVPMIHAVYSDRNVVIEVLKALKEADLGYSVVVSGVLDDVASCARAAGIQRYSVDISLAIWGALDKLPSVEILEVTTMCGHGMISANLVRKMVNDICAGRTTARKAAYQLGEPCACGIFNEMKAERLLQKAADAQVRKSQNA